MPIHSLLFVSKVSDKLVFSRYFGVEAPSSKVEKEAFEAKVAQHTRLYWSELAQAGGNGQKRRTVCLDSSIVLSFCVVGDLVLYVNGTDDFDEATLVEPGETITELLLRLLDMKEASQVREKDLLEEENKDIYAKLVLGVDELVGPSGHVEDLDVPYILRKIKLKT